MLALIGIALLIAGGFQGGFLIIFPFIMTSSPLDGLGILLLMFGGLLLFFGLLTEHMGYEVVGSEGAGETKVESRGLGLVMVGPVPLIIDTKNRKLTLISLAVFIVGIAILIAVFLI